MRLPRFFLALLAASATTASAVLLVQTSILAAEPNLKYQQISQEIAASSAINVFVSPGRISAIDFSATGEVITYIGLGDSSRVVYNTDLPLETNLAQTILILPIQPLTFPGATTTQITNLVAKTVDSRGVSRLYNFQINHSNRIANLGIKIAPQTSNSLADSEPNLIKVSNDRTANLDDVARGLTIAINQGYTEPNDPVVHRVRQFLALARNGNLSLIEAAQSANVELAVITALAEMALDRFTQTAKYDSVAIETIGLESDANSDRAENQQENEQLLVGSSQTTETKNVKDEGNVASVAADETQSSRDRSSEKEEDLSVYLTKQPPKSIQPEKSSFDNRVDFIIQANNLYFGWQQLLKQNQLVVDEITQHKLTEVINLVRRGNGIEAAIERVGLEKEIGSRLIALANRGDITSNQ